MTTQPVDLVSCSASNFADSAGGPAEHPQHRHPPPTPPVALVRQPQGWRPGLTPKGVTHQAPISDEGQPYGRTREEQQHHRCTVPHDARPTWLSSFRLLGMASPNEMLVGSY